jgi:hypothetical protein
MLPLGPPGKFPGCDEEQLFLKTHLRKAMVSCISPETQRMLPMVFIFQAS